MMACAAKGRIKALLIWYAVTPPEAGQYFVSWSTTATKLMVAHKPRGIENQANATNQSVSFEIVEYNIWLTAVEVSFDDSTRLPSDSFLSI